MGEGVAEEAGDAHRHVDPRPAQLGERESSSTPVTRRDSAVPHRPDAEQGQRLGHVVALRCAWPRSPTATRPTRLGVAARLARWRSIRRGRPARWPTSHASGDGSGLGVDASRSCARSAARGAIPGSGAPLGPGGTAPAVEARRAGRRSRPGCRRRAGTSRLAHPARASDRRRRPRRRPARGRRRLDQTRRHSASTASTSTRSARRPGRRRARRRDRGPQGRHRSWGSRVMASTRSTRASPSGARPRMCSPPRIWASLSSHR